MNDDAFTKAADAARIAQQSADEKFLRIFLPVLGAVIWFLVGLIGVWYIRSGSLMWNP